MSGDRCGSLTRRRMLVAAAAMMVPETLAAQGFAGLGRTADGFSAVTPGRAFAFPADHGSHPDFRIEWWYVTANLIDSTGARYGAQWTLFRQSTTPRDPGEGWDSQQIWMGHAAVTSATMHRFAETFSRGGIGTAAAEASPLHAWIDGWQMKAADDFDPLRTAPLHLSAEASDLRIALRLDADAPLTLQGDRGYSAKSERGQASYYFSQPFFRAAGHLAIEGRAIEVTGQAWLDREFSSQPLSGDQTGWDWLSLHLEGGDKLMLFRLREKNGGSFLSGNWVARDAPSVQLAANDIKMAPLATTKIADRSVPTSWRVNVASRGLDITLAPLNAQSWMGTRFPYWEGPISFSGSHRGVGYLEMTGY